MNTRFAKEDYENLTNNIISLYDGNENGKKKLGVSDDEKTRQEIVAEDTTNLDHTEVGLFNLRDAILMRSKVAGRIKKSLMNIITQIISIKIVTKLCMKIMMDHCMEI